MSKCEKHSIHEPQQAVCAVCKKASDLPFQCAVCELVFCLKHRAPGNCLCGSFFLESQACIRQSSMHGAQTEHINLFCPMMDHHLRREMIKRREHGCGKWENTKHKGSSDAKTADHDSNYLGRPD
jgi:hypothetical protein